MAKYYPTSVLSTARDIITLWVARMVIFGLFNLNKVPFKNVYIHPVIQDGHGKRMSKSAGNGVDPVDIVEIYGADALRYTLAAGSTETQDLRMPVEQLTLPDGRVVNTSERFEQGRNFANKFWNAGRLALLNLEGYEPAPVALDTLPIEDRWILDGLDRTIRDATTDLEAFQFAELARRLRDFTWNDFCDAYLEFVKGRLRDSDTRPLAQRVLATVLDRLCRLLHPVMPFVTEQVWQSLNDLAPQRGIDASIHAEPSLCIGQWPTPSGWQDATAPKIVELWRETIKSLRNLRAERNLTKDARIAPLIVARGLVADYLALGTPLIKSLVPAETITIVPAADRPAQCAVAVLPELEIILPLEGLIDQASEIAKHRKSLQDVERQIAPLQSKLANESFVSRAPQEVVSQSRAKLQELESQRQAILALLEGK
jgi:valyl-tRNA synthetase